MKKVNKSSQTFRWDENLLEALKKESGVIPFNRFCENLMKTHPALKKYKLPTT